MNVPKLRFKEFNDEWQNYKVEEILKISNGINKEKEFFGSGTPIINYMDVNKNELISHNIVKGLVTANSKELETFNVKKGDILFTRTSETSDEIGLSSSVIENIDKCIFSGFILKGTQTKQFIHPYFGGYYFRNPKMRKEIIKHSSITTRALTSGSLLSQMSISIPTIIEQEKIGKTLSLLDKKIELQAKKIEDLKLFKKGLLYNEKRNNNLWNEYKISDIMNITRGTVIPKTEISESLNNEFRYPVYSSQTSNNGILGYDNKYDFNGKFLTWTTDGANAGKVFYREGKFRCTNVCGILYNKDNRYVSELTAELLNIETPKYVSYVGNPKLMNNVMSNIIIKLPDPSRDYFFSSILKIINKKLTIEEEKLDKLFELKKGLMQNMFV